MSNFQNMERRSALSGRLMQFNILNSLEQKKQEGKLSII